MSALGGVLLAPTDAARLPALIAGLAGGLAGRGPDGCSIAFRGAVGMVYRPFHTTPGASSEHQPVGDGDLLVTLDGRIDEREELARQLGGGQASDTELVARAYRRWGDDMPFRLVGDFALAVWDRHERRLLLARDPFGSRPLFYAQGPGSTLTWASNVSALRAVASLDDALDEDWVASYLAGVIAADRSPFRAVRALAPGHLLVADPDRGIHLRSFWPGALEAVRLADDGEYEERFTALFSEAVASRLRSCGPVFAELSGGLDSSSIVCLADRIMRWRGDDPAGLQTVSFVFDEATSSDEREFIDAVAAQTDRPAHRFGDRQSLLFDGGGPARFEVPTTLSTFLPRHLLLADAMRRAGARVLLSGIGGDDVTISQVEAPLHLAELAQLGQFRALGRELAAWQQELGTPLAQLVLEGVILPLLPGRLGTRWRPAEWPVAAWADGSFARRTGLEERSRPRPGPAERHLPPVVAMRVAALRATVAQQVAPRYVEAEALGREIRYPFLDRSLVEFCLGLPGDQLVRSLETRSVHRRALTGILPQVVAERRDKRGPDEAMMRAVGRHWPTLHDMFAGDARIYDHGYVAREPYLAALEATRFGLLHRAGNVFRAIELEIWLQSLERC